MTRSCQKCKNWKACPSKPWYHYGEIQWCIYQVKWIITNAEALETGDWPPAPNVSEIDPKVSTGYKSEAYYVKAVSILAELEYRLKRTGVSGKLLRAEVLADLELSQEAVSALHYCKGWRRKRMPFNDWQNQRSYRMRLPKVIII